MKINFDWVAQINSSLKNPIEEKIKEDIEKSDDLTPCHAEPLSVSFLTTDPLDVSIKGSIRCSCGKEIKTFSSNSDGSIIHFFDPKSD